MRGKFLIADALCLLRLTMTADNQQDLEFRVALHVQGGFSCCLLCLNLIVASFGMMATMMPQF